MLNKIKNAWKNNRVMVVLTSIVIVCVIVMLVILFRYFMGASISNYGDRLDNVKEVPVTSEVQNKIKESFACDQLISVTVDIKGKIIYVIATFKEGISLTDAQNKGVSSFEALSEEYRKLYDYNVTVSQEATEGSSGFHLMGAKNINSSAFVWNNNTPVSGD